MHSEAWMNVGYAGMQPVWQDKANHKEYAAACEAAAGAAGSGLGFEEAKARACGKLIEFVREILGEDMAELLDVSPRSRFLADLGMDSIRIVSFAQMVHSYYGERVDFMAWLTKKPLKALLKAEVGEVAEVIAAAICSEAAEVRH